MSLDLKVKLSFCTAYQQSLCTLYVLQSWNISCDIKYHLLWSLIDVRRQRPTDVPWMVVLLHTTIINWAKVSLLTIFSPLVFTRSWASWKWKKSADFNGKSKFYLQLSNLLNPNFMVSINIFCIFVCPKKSTDQSDFAVDFFLIIFELIFVYLEIINFLHIEHSARL